MPGRRYAVLFGNGVFSPDQKTLQPLRCPINDVKDLGNLLASGDHGGYIVTPISDGNHDEIKIAIYKCLVEAAPDDLVLIYFSGHGKLDQNGNLYFVTKDTRVEALPPTSVSLEDLRKYIEDSPASKVVVVLDCCFSGAVKNMYKADVSDQASEAIRGLEGEGRFYLTASMGTQLAEEKEGDEYSLLTKHIIEGIKDGSADKNDDGDVSFQELCAYVQKEVPREGKQKPRSWSLDSAGEVVIAFTGKPACDARRKAVTKKLHETSLEGLLTSDAVTNLLTTIDRPSSEVLTSGKSVQELIDSFLPR